MASRFRKGKCSEISVGSFLLGTGDCLDEFFELSIQAEKLEHFLSSAQALTGADHILEMPWSGQGDQIIMRLKLYHY